MTKKKDKIPDAITALMAFKSMTSAFSETFKIKHFGNYMIIAKFLLAQVDKEAKNDPAK